jgi:hypothetical protein
MFEEIHNEVEAGIWDGQYDVNKRNVKISIVRIIFSIKTKSSSL